MHKDFARIIIKEFLEDCKSRLAKNTRLIARYNHEIERLKEDAKELTKESNDINQRLSKLENTLKNL